MTNESSPLDDLNFWAQVLTDARRVIVCPPDLESRLITRLQLEGLDHIYDIRPSPACPPNQILIIDEQGINAEMSKPIRPRLT